MTNESIKKQLRKREQEIITASALTIGITILPCFHFRLLRTPSQGKKRPVHPIIIDDPEDKLPLRAPCSHGVQGFATENHLPQNFDMSQQKPNVCDWNAQE